jgi:hypothetical protein
MLYIYIYIYICTQMCYLTQNKRKWPPCSYLSRNLIIINRMKALVFAHTKQNQIGWFLCHCKSWGSISADISVHNRALGTNNNNNNTPAGSGPIFSTSEFGWGLSWPALTPFSDRPNYLWTWHSDWGGSEGGEHTPNPLSLHPHLVVSGTHWGPRRGSSIITFSRFVFLFIPFSN